MASQGGVQVWDWQSDERLDLNIENIRFVVFSPLEPIGVIVVNDHDAPSSRIELWNIEQVSRNVLFEIQGETLGEPVFSPDGNLLAVPNNRGMIRVWETKTNELLETFEGQPPVAFSKSGKALAYRNKGGIMIRDVTANVQRVQITTLPDYYTRVFFNGDESLIFGNGYLWSTATGEQLSRIGSGGAFYGMYGDQVWIADMSRDDKLIAVTLGGGVRLWVCPLTIEVVFVRPSARHYGLCHDE
jgi:WD40 repeat protein